MSQRKFPRNVPRTAARLLSPFALLLCLFATQASAERLPVRVYTTADGLGSGAINWLLRDSRGFLWLATRDGLSRFDGQRFTTYRFGKGKSPSVSEILERRRGDYLVALQSGEVYRFDDNTEATAGDSTADDTLTLSPDLLVATDMSG